jgi:hypothetical protein
MRALWGRIKDRLLGPKCPRCFERVFANDQTWHDMECD